MSIIKNYVPAKGVCKVTFSYPAAEGVKSVQVLGDFNNWDSKVGPKMKKSKDGFTAALELAAGNTYEFRYLLNGEKWDNDFHADKYVSSPYAGINNSVIVLDAVAAAPKAKATASKAAPVKKETVKVTPAKPATAKAAPVKKDVVKAAKPVAEKAKEVKVVAPKAVKAPVAKVEKASTAKPAVKKEVVAKAKPAAAPKTAK